MRSGTFQTGLRLKSGRAKPSWSAYRLPIFVTASGRRHVHVFGQVRPAGSRRVSVQHKARAKSAWRTVARVRVNRAGYLYRRLTAHGGFWRLSWRSAAGAAVAHSRTARVN